jgi:hypothetical protein
MLFQSHTPSTNFKQWIWKDRENRRLIWLSAFAILIIFTGLKVFYPYPNFTSPESDSYMEAALNNQDINIYAIGYSKFLRLFSSFSRSSLSLVLFQYLFLEACLLYFLFSIRYFLSPGKWAFRIIISCGVLNPMLLQVSNLISSDALFTALSLLWFTQLLWILYSPNRRLLLLHAIILLLAFMVSYESIYYPFISIATIVFSKSRKNIKIESILIIVGLLGAFMIRTAHQYHLATSTPYSSSGGWQLAANALYAYAHASPDPPEKVPAEFRQLHTLVNEHMTSLQRIPFFLRPDHYVGNYYQFDERSPLKVYMNKYWAKDSVTGYLKRHATMATIYAGYGSFLIQKHPGYFLKDFIWPNFIKYYVPSPGPLGIYNMGKDTVSNIAVGWFAWKDNKIRINYKNKINAISRSLPEILASINLLFILCFVAFISLDGFAECSPNTKRVLKLTLVLWGSNMIFSILVAPIELRRQLFPMAITLSFVLLLIEFIIQQTRSTRLEITSYQKTNPVLI